LHYTKKSAKIKPVPKNKSVAYFCLEYAIEDKLPIYVGGLGVLAGDYLLEAGKQDLPFWGIGLFYHHELTEPSGSGFRTLKDESRKEVLLEVEIREPGVLAKVWQKSYGTAQLFLLDTNIPQNSPEDREITKILYDPNPKNLLLQQLILGIGGVKLLDFLGIRPDVYHLNEGHTSFAILGLLAKQGLVLPPQNPIVATKHTIFSGAGSYIGREEFNQLLAYYCHRHKLDIEKLFGAGSCLLHPNHFSTTRFLLAYTRKSNCVSQSHCSSESQVHPDSRLINITNGINPDRWQAPGWQEMGKKKPTAEQIWNLHQNYKKEMLQLYGKNFDPYFLTLVWARRITPYKRPLLIFSDLERLIRLVNNPDRPVQIIIYGKIKEDDTESLGVENQITFFCQNPQLEKRVIFCPDYSLAVAKKVVAGADVWLSTPEIGKEACSTSSMKSGLNGVLQLSTNDGWIREVNWDNIGWVIPENNVSQNLYAILENGIVPLYYERDRNNLPQKWAERMRQTTLLVQGKYTTARMLRDYQNKLYRLK
jgi:glucan phosphorylase